MLAAEPRWATPTLWRSELRSVKLVTAGKQVLKAFPAIAAAVGQALD